MKQQLSHQQIREIEKQCEQMRSEAIFNSFAALFIGLKTKFVEMVKTTRTNINHNGNRAMRVSSH